MKFVLLAAMPGMFAGCASTNPKPAFDDVNQIVTERLGQPVDWLRDNSSSNQVAEAVVSLLQTNLTAQSATAIALLNNKSLQAEFEGIGISQADRAQASRLPNPQVFGDWRFPNQPPSTVDIEYNAAWNFLDLLTLPVQKKIATRNLEETKQSVGDKVLQLAATTQIAFYTLQAQMELTNRLALNVEVNDAAAEFARRQYQAGNITGLALHEQQASAAQAQFIFMQAQTQVAADRERLNRLFGLSDDQINWSITDELPPLSRQEPSLTRLESLAMSQRLDLAAARTQVRAFAAALRLKEKTRFIPGVALGVDTERTPDGQRVTGPTLDLELPLFDQGQPEVARLAAQYRRAEDNYAALEVNVRSEVRQAQDALSAARAAVEFSQKNLLPLQQEILGETLRQYNAMGKSVFDLLLAKENEQTAEESAITALRDYWVARVELERAVGGRLSETFGVSSNKNHSQITSISTR